MVVPCMVNRRLNSSGPTTFRPGQASCHRIMLASKPPMRKKMSPAVTYMTPSFLWSDVAIHSWSLVVKVAPRA